MTKTENASKEEITAYREEEEITMKNTADIKFLELCEEIDYWKVTAKHWEIAYKNLQTEHTAMLKDSIRHGEEMVGGFLSLVLNNDIVPRKEEVTSCSTKRQYNIG